MIDWQVMMGEKRCNREDNEECRGGTWKEKAAMAWSVPNQFDGCISMYVCMYVCMCGF